MNWDYMLEPRLDLRAERIFEMVYDWSEEKVVAKAVELGFWNPADEDVNGNPIPRPSTEDLREYIIDHLYWSEE